MSRRELTTAIPGGRVAQEVTRGAFRRMARCLQPIRDGAAIDVFSAARLYRRKRDNPLRRNGYIAAEITGRAIAGFGRGRAAPGILRIAPSVR